MTTTHDRGPSTAPRSVSADSTATSTTPESSSWVAVASLGLGIFAIIMSEFMPASLLCRMASDLGVCRDRGRRTALGLAPVTDTLTGHAPVHRHRWLRPGRASPTTDSTGLAGAVGPLHDRTRSRVDISEVVIRPGVF
jgi:hypothetical protein